MSMLRNSGKGWRHLLMAGLFVLLRLSPAQAEQPAELRDIYQPGLLKVG